MSIAIVLPKACSKIFEFFLFVCLFVCLFVFVFVVVVVVVVHTTCSITALHVCKILVILAYMITDNQWLRQGPWSYTQACIYWM